MIDRSKMIEAVVIECGALKHPDVVMLLGPKGHR